eukprot:GILJ01010837.1.p1 GENE.GILJ01010837.1~~GILJ01010837.1.p1  ORF type:complete len:596 (-),score=61.55 GILJ01010837.1:108-1895(-)
MASSDSLDLLWDADIDIVVPAFGAKIDDPVSLLSSTPTVRETAFQGEVLPFYLVARRRDRKSPDAHVPHTSANNKVTSAMWIQYFKALSVDVQLLDEEPAVAASAPMIPTVTAPKSALTAQHFEAQAYPLSGSPVPSAVYARHGAGSCVYWSSEESSDTNSRESVIYKVDLGILVKPAYIDRPLQLIASVTAPAFPDPVLKQQMFSAAQMDLAKPTIGLPSAKTEHYLTEIYKRSLNARVDTPVRRVHRALRVVQPLQVKSTHSLVGNKHIIGVEVENTTASVPPSTTVSATGLSLSVLDIEFHLANTSWVVSRNAQDPGKYMQPPNVNHFFRAHVNKSDGDSIVLNPGDQYNFIIYVESLPTTVDVNQQQFGIYGVFHTPLTLTWKASCVDYSSLSQYRLQWGRPQAQNITVSMTAESPVPLHSVVSVSVSVTNLTDRPMDLSAEIPVAYQTSIKEFRPAIILNQNLMSSTQSTQDGGRSVRSLSNPVELDKKYDMSPMPSSSDLIPRPALPLSPALSQDIALLPLEETVHLGIVNALGCKTIQLHFLTMKEGLQEISGLQFSDHRSHVAYAVAEPFQLYILGNIAQADGLPHQ